MLTYMKNENEMYILIFRESNDYSSYMILCLILGLRTDDIFDILKKYHCKVDARKRIIFQNENEILNCIDELNALSTINKLAEVK